MVFKLLPSKHYLKNYGQDYDRIGVKGVKVYIAIKTYLYAVEYLSLCINRLTFGVSY